MSTLNPTDTFLVKRGSTLYQAPVARVGPSIGGGVSDKAVGGSVFGDTDGFVHVFYSSGSFVVNETLSGVAIWILGGGGGGGSATGGGGGGGADVYAATGSPLPAGTYTVTVGAGGAGGPFPGASNGQSGGSSSFSPWPVSNTAFGGSGGGGGSNSGGSQPSGSNRGSGGGGGGNTYSSTSGGGGYTVGGNGFNLSGGGGGGRGSTGGRAPPSSQAGNNSTIPAGQGGSGHSNDGAIGHGYPQRNQVTPALYSAGGGGGGGRNGPAIGLGRGNGGAGRPPGTQPTITGYNGHKGDGGGGGGGQQNAGGNGGSGMVVIRYQRDLRRS